MNRILALAAAGVLLAGCTTTTQTPDPATTTTLTLGSTTPSTPPGPSESTETGAQTTVARVVDGDTIDVQEGTQRVRVRILAVDTPEKYGGVECFGLEASAHTAALLPVGAVVRLDPDPTQDDTDRYGRALRYVDVAGTDIGLELVRGGYANAYKLKSGPAPARYAEYAAAEQAAAGARVGMWSACPKG